MRVWGCLAASIVTALLLVGSASAINSVRCGSTIKSPGSYQLTADCSGQGIVIKASNVTLDLHRHTMTGTGGGNNAGIWAQSQSNIRIEGPGIIKGFYIGIYLPFDNATFVGNVTVKKTTWDGVFTYYGSHHTFQGTMSMNTGHVGFWDESTDQDMFDSVTATGNGASGIYVTGSTSAMIGGSTLNGNGDSGVAIDGHSQAITVQNSTADGNTVGVYIGSGSTNNVITSNQAFSNSSYDLEDQNSACDANTWSGNSFGSANQGCIG